MKPALRLKDARWTWTNGTTVGPFDLEVLPGERVLLAGASGSGKSTLLLLASNLFGPGSGVASGTRELFGDDVSALSVRERAERLGFVSQDPGDQVVSGTLRDELALGPCHLGWPAERIRSRVAQCLVTQLPGLDADRPVHALSGGQQQRLVSASALAGNGRLLLLDEPLAQLDTTGTDALLAMLWDLSEQGTAVVLAEHRTARVAPWATRVVWLSEPPSSLGPAPAAHPPGRLLLEAKALSVAIEGRTVLDRVDLSVCAGERIAVVGENGAGKSTLLAQLATHPSAMRHGTVIRLPQDPDLSLFCPTVRAELEYGPRERGSEVDVEGIARQLGVLQCLDRPPQALSRGERLRVAVGSVLACRPDVLLLDEPTSGQDPEHVEAILEALHAQPDLAVVFATHDRALVGRWATRQLALPPPKPDRDSSPRTRTSALDPRTRLLALLAVGTWAVLLDAPWTLFALSAACAIPFLTLPIGWKWRLRGLFAALTLVWSTVVSQGLFYGDLPRTPLFALGPLTVYREGIGYGLVQSLRMVAVGFLGISLALRTPTDALQRALVRLGVPWTIAFLAGTALRLVPQTGREWWEVRQARARRGRPLLKRTPWAWLALEVALLRPVVARTLRRARRMASSLEARGFAADVTPTILYERGMGIADRSVLALLMTVTLALLISEMLFFAYQAELAYFTALRPLYGFVRTWL